MQRLRPVVVLSLILAGPVPVVRANKVTELHLVLVSDLSVKVSSTSGTVYDKVESTGPLFLLLDADCRFDKKPGFQEHALNELVFDVSGLAEDLDSPFMRESGRGYWVETPFNGQVELETTWIDSPDTRLADPVKACNDELARRVFAHPDTPREKFLAEGFSVTVPEGGRAKVTLWCNPLSAKAGFTDFHDQEKRFDLEIDCLPSKAAKEKLVDAGTVEIRSFTLARKKATIQCPGKVPFRATIDSKARVSGEAWLEYLPAGPGSHPQGTSKKVPWSVNRPGPATSTLEQPWNPVPADKWTRGKTRLVVRWKDSAGNTFTARSKPVTFERRCSASATGDLALAPRIDGETVRIVSFAVDKPKAAITCPGKVTFRATIESKERLSGQVWLETVPKVGRPRAVGRRHPWQVNRPGKATSTIDQPWKGPAGQWVDGRTRLVVSWKNAKGKTFTARSKPVSFQRQCIKSVKFKF